MTNIAFLRDTTNPTASNKTTKRLDAKRPLLVFAGLLAAVCAAWYGEHW